MSEHPPKADEPLGHRGLEVWHIALAVTAVFGVAMVVVAVLSR